MCCTGELKEAIAPRANFSGAALSKVASPLPHGTRTHPPLPPKVEFTGAQLQGATFRGATLDAVNFAECDLDGADFTGATIVSAEFGNARGRAIGLPAGVSKSMATRG